jgi:hypothetical protein
MLHSSGQNVDIIKIDVSVFKKHYLSFNKKQIPDSLYKKKQEIYNNHSCFHISFDKDAQSGQRQNYQNKPYTNYHQNAATVGKNQNRLYIITSDFTEDTKIKKQFMSHLNKLTEHNKDCIYPKIKDLLDAISDAPQKEAMYSIVWDFIKKTPNDIYISVLQYFDNSMTLNYLDKYINHKQWYPPAYAFENDLLTADEQLYDMYCDYVKWKNYVTNTIKVVCTLDAISTKQIDRLLNDFYDLFFENLYKPTTKHIVHFALEQLHNILKLTCASIKNREIRDKLKVIDTKDIESSSKFLIMDILSQ